MSLKSILRGIPLFHNLSDEGLDLVASRLRKKNYVQGSILFKEGDLGDTMYLVESGRLVVLDQKKEEYITSIGPGNFVGDISLLLTQPRTATVQVTIDAQLWLLDKKDFDDLIDTRPAIALEMIRELSRRLLTTTRRRRKSATRRITVLSGSQKGLELAEAVYAYLKEPVALFPLPKAKLGHQAKPSHGVMIVAFLDLTEASLAESLSHQVEVYKHIIVVVPDQPDKLARKAVNLADTVVSVGEPPVGLLTDGEKKDLWFMTDTDADLSRIARKLTNRVIGLALSSGGARGLSHVGVLKVLMEENIPVDMIAGSSAGALFGALFASGWKIEQFETYIEHLKGLTSFPNWDFNIPPWTGIVKGKRARDKFLAEPLGDITFEELKTPLYIVAGDILTGEEVIFDSGPVADAIRASASIPILGDPWHYQGRFFIDGGVVNPLPANVLRDRHADIIIASNVAQPPKESYSGPLDKMPRVWNIVFNIMNAMEAEMIKKQIPLIDVLIHHGVSAKHSLDFECTSDLIRVGEKTARRMLPDIKKVIEAPPEV